MAGRKKRKSFKEKDLRGLKYFRPIRKLLKSQHGEKDHPNRNLHYDEYISLLLLYFFTPSIQSLRYLQKTSTFDKVKRKLGIKHSSLGSLSEASHVFDPAPLKEIFRDLADQAAARDAVPRPRGVPEDLEVIAADGMLLEALPRMVWALWLREHDRAVKVHLQLDVLRGVPVEADVTHANANECEMLADRLAPGRLYVVDRGYNKFTLFQRILNAKSSFLGRVQENTVDDLIEDKVLSHADREAGVVFDRVVKLGCRQRQGDLDRPVRLIKVHVKNPPASNLKPRRKRVSSKKTFRESKEEYDLLLVTDRMEFSAETIALLYHYRWQVEIFFRWMKCTLGCRHLLAESENGVTIQVYAGLIATLLIMLWTGRKPNKMALFMVDMYLAGWASLKELKAELGKLKKLDR